MKTALIYSGQARVVADVWENHRWFLRKLPNPDLFVSVADDPQADDTAVLKKAFPQARFELEKVAQPQIPEPKAETPLRSGYPTTATDQGILRQLWALDRAWKFFTEKANPADYDLIVRVRPDVVFLRMDAPCLTVPKWTMVGGFAFPEAVTDTADFAPMVDPKLCLVPWWARWSGVNDRFAILGRTAAEHYFGTFSKLDTLWAMGCPLHPETMVAASLELGGIVPDDTLRAEFTTIRMPSPEHPRGGRLQCDPTVVDVADAASKGIHR